NSESESVARHELQRLIVARYVRFVPLQWSKEGRIGLRVEVFGCSYCSNQYSSIQGHTSVSSGSLLDDEHWHSVFIQRYRRNVNFTLDHHTQQFRTNGEFDQLDLDY
ncbi:hypothetical protein CRUP_015948, partial [Coryphaenoides rupestris]